jgi:CheY-like chemotaxis protein/anti-sigma regulatory factor (Ser/Thr protein kinase)
MQSQELDDAFEEADVPTILIVDDSPIDQRLAAGIVQRRLDAAVEVANDGLQALSAIESHPPDLVVTDLQMPKMDGLELVRNLRKNRIHVPVIIMTSRGSEEIAIQALKAGAASYIPKRNLAELLEPTVKQVLNAVEMDRYSELILSCQNLLECQFVIPNDPALIDPLAYYLRQRLIEMKLCGEDKRTRLYVALSESLRNAMYHGNLEIAAELRSREGPPNGNYLDLIEERRHRAPYKDRLIYVHASLTREEAVIRVRDEGSGFNPSSVPDPTDPSNLDSPHGRGLFLIYTFMDTVRFNVAGNEISMVKRRDP